MATWRCIDHCGACCYLDPSERPDLADYLSEDELVRYLSMVGEDGWCINFDQLTRRCQIYSDRPRFCRVEPEVFYDMFGVLPDEMDDFAIDCCVEQIESVYGDRSLEMARYQQAIASTPDMTGQNDS
ncbi:MAG: YkgJ family cysteine cluster protein [Elainellaceae cyanobacterium]